MTVTVVSLVTDGESAAVFCTSIESRAGVCATTLPPASANDNAKASFITSSFDCSRTHCVRSD
jgi:hypothetical protein